IPPELDEITLKALSPDPADRYQTAREFSSALARAVFTMGELADSQSLEATIVGLFGERIPEDLAESEGDSDIAHSERPELRAFDPHEGTPVEPLVAATEEGSEVRHVAVLSFALRNLDALVKELGHVPARVAGKGVRSTLHAIAFKRNILLGW